jgi:hypothetical protein
LITHQKIKRAAALIGIYRNGFRMSASTLFDRIRSISHLAPSAGHFAFGQHGRTSRRSVRVALLPAGEM